MDRVELKIYDASTKQQKACVNKWKFQDAMMGERFITFTVTSEKPIDWSVGDYCVYRDETFWLNNIPTVTQKAPINTVQDGFTYENVKFDSSQEELTRCMMLDVTPTTPEYIAVLGTNHTGSSRFQLYCGETTYDGQTLTPVCALALKIQANLDRLYPNKWHVYVDTVSTYTTSSGKVVLATHTDDKMLSFDNTTVAAALAMVNSEFDLDFTVRFRNIFIGYALNELTADDVGEMFVFGYGKGYPSADNQGKGLFMVKQMANSQQKIVTRLRALGSTKNMPYRYYNKKYGGESNPDLSQSLFPTNLQLPGTFLPEGEPTDAANAKGSTKWARNNARSEYLRAVKGDTNDSFIDKNDDAESCNEGIREDSARWDGSNSELPEIYPTIEGVTYGELREGGVEDMDGNAGVSSFQGSTVHPDTERIDSLLAVGYTDNGVLIDDANVGDGIQPGETTYATTVKPAVIGQTRLDYRAAEYGEGLDVYGDETELFTIKDVSPGKYFMAPTGGSYSSVVFSFRITSGIAMTRVGYIVKVKQRAYGGALQTIAQYTSLDVEAQTTTTEMYLPELPDSKDAPDEQVESITVTALSDIIVTFTPVLYNTSGHNFSLVYQVGRSLLHPSDDYDPEYNWGPVDGGIAANGPFHVFIKDMGFDLTATFTGDTPVMAMKSGRCVGREFEIGKNVSQATVNGVKGYLLTLNRAQDSNLGIYYPNENDPIAAGDYFVLLGISMPDAYIEAAEARLLMAATDYLADNCETKFTYQPSIDDIYLQRQHENMVKAGTPEKSIYSRLYAGLRFSFHGIPSRVPSPTYALPRIDIAIQQVTITMGEGLTPKVDIVLNDDVQQSTIQRLTTAVDRIYNGSAYASGGGANLGMLYELLLTEGGKMFLSKVNDDTANGKITFNDMVTMLGLLKSKGGVNVGDFVHGWLGTGANIGADGRAEFESVYIRGALRAAEIVFNQIRAEGGEKIESIGYGEILTVDEANMIAALKLDGDAWATIDTGDICRGLYNTIDKDFTVDETGEDANGFRNEKGFFASYFKVEEILTNKKGECSFRYSLQTDGNGNVITEHPCPLMKFAVYGNFDNAKKERQSSIYTTAVGIAPRQLYLAGVNDWAIRPENIKVANGNIEGLQVYEKKSDGSIALKTLHGDAGLFVEDNIYLGGVIEQFIHASLDEILDELGQGIHAELTRGSDNIVVDALGNIVGGIYNEYSGGNRHYRLHTGILVYDSGKECYMTPASGDTIGENEFAIYYNCEGCDVIRDGADFYVTNIHNTNDGISDTTLTDAELEQMRNTEECKVNFTIVTNNGWRTIISYPIRITHLDHGYITFSLDNEFDSIAYRTQTKKYDGLPIETHIRGYVNGEEVGVVSTSVKTNFTTSDMSEETLTADGDTIVTRYFRNDSASGVKMELTKAGKLTLKAYTKSSDDIDYDDAFYYFDIKSVVKYAGVLYESAWRRFTLTEITDSTLYKLLLSATSVSKDGGTFTPSTVDVKVQVSNNNGTSVAVPDEYGNIAGIAGIKVRYLKGVYSPNGTNNWLTSMPSFADPSVTTCVTVVCIDMSGSQPLVLDVQSITINAVGKDGAGQPYVKTNIDQYVVDCDSNGLILANDPLTIDAELYWGDNKCGLTNSQCVVRYKGSTVTHSYDSIGESISVSLDFVSGQSLSSGNVEISLVGIDGGGDSHSAIKTIAIIANRQGRQGDKGDNGNDGNGIDGVVTYYLATTKFTGVTTSDTGWVEYFVEPTAELPYLWRFTRYTYTTNGSTPYDTPCELVKTYYTDGNPNLLGDALFIADSMGAWDKKGALSSSVEVADNFTPVFATSSSFNAQTNGHRQFRGTFKAKSTDGYITLLSQFVHKDTGLSKVEASQWYTLSFLLYGTRDDQTNADFVLAADVSQIADSNVNVFIDGQERPASYAYRNFTVTNTFTRHTMTFKAKSSLSGDLSIVWYMHPRTYTQNVYISEPKLELGKVATQFSAAPFIDKPMTRTSTWQEGMDYQAGQQGEKYLDIVDYNGGWYRCQKSHISTNANKPDEAQQYTEYWFKANKFEFIATNLLLANEAIIKNLVAEALRTAPIGRPHVEMKGSTVQFYGDLSTPSIELMSDKDGVGVLRFYDKDGNVMYDLGPNKILDNFSDTPSSYKTLYYKSLNLNGNVRQMVSVSGDSVSETNVTGLPDNQCTGYYVLSEGYSMISPSGGGANVMRYNISGDSRPSVWNGKTLVSEYTDTTLSGYSSLVASMAIPDGWYAKSNELLSDISSASESYTDYVIMYEFSGGVNVSQVNVYLNLSELADGGTFCYDEQGNHFMTLRELVNSKSIIM